MVELTLAQKRTIALARARKAQAEAQLTGADAMRARGLASPDPAAANAEAMKPETNLVEQVGSGTNEGIAGMVGLPVDAVTGGLNMGARALGLPEIEKPVGGSESLRGILAPFITEAEPQTAAQRIGRRVGQDVGAGAVAAPVAGVASLGGMALNTGADLASGLAGGVTSEVTDNPTLNLIASMLGGGGVIAGSRAMRPGVHVPTNEELRATADDLYGRVRDSDFRLTPRQVEELKGDVSARVWDRMDPPNEPKAVSGVNRVYGVDDYSPNGGASLEDIENARRFVGRKVLSSKEPAEQEIGVEIRRAMDDYVDRMATAPDAAEDVATLRAARDTARRYIASEKLDLAIDKSARRAARSGSGGNAINTQRQNVDALLNSPRDASSFRPAEQETMREIVFGTRATNGLRTVGGLSPTKGALMAGLNSGAVMGTLAGTGGNPVLTGLAATPGIIGMIAKQLGEHLTDQQVRRLSAQIRFGGAVPAKTMTQGERAVLNALLGAQAAEQAQQ